MNEYTKTHLLDYVFDQTVRNDSASMIAAIDNFSRHHGGMIHLGSDKGKVFDRIVRQSGARRVLELGTNYGYSALRLARNLDGATTIHTIEIDQGLADTAAAIIGYAGLDGRIDIICGKAHEIIPSFSEPFDLVFIDHLPENYLGDLYLLERSGLLRTGTIVVTDNVVIFEQHLKPYLDHLRRGGGYDSTLHQPSPTSDGMEVSIRLDTDA